jgi:hypothetical protein
MRWLVRDKVVGWLGRRHGCLRGHSATVPYAREREGRMRVGDTDRWALQKIHFSEF